MAEVSVIVPVYQVEQYLRQCLNSILNQTFKDIEVILVDDGSMDNSGKICDEYALQDKRVRVIHQQNSGVAASRNHGLTTATGKYICFVDSDDWIDQKLIENCINCIEKHDVDVLRHGFTLELWKNGQPVSEEKKYAPDFTEVLRHEEIASQMEMFWNNCSNYVWNYFFKKEAISNIEFPEIIISEDHVFVLHVLEQCNGICYLEDEGYHYCMRMGSSANRWQEKGIDCQLVMIEACHHLMNSFGIDDLVERKLMANMIVNAYSYVIYLLCFPECKWSVKQKIEKIKEIRRILDVDLYVPYIRTSGLGIGDQVKWRLICWKKENLLIRLGPLFMKLVRKVGSSKEGGNE